MKTHYGKMAKEELQGVVYSGSYLKEFSDMCDSAGLTLSHYMLQSGKVKSIRCDIYNIGHGEYYFPTSRYLKGNLDWQPKPDDDLIKIVELCGKEWPDNPSEYIVLGWVDLYHNEPASYVRLKDINKTSAEYNKTQFNACVEYLDSLEEQENKSQGAIFINDLVKGLTGVNLNLEEKEEEKEMTESKLKPGDWINISNLESSERKEIVQYMLDNGCSINKYWDAMTGCCNVECLLVDDDMSIDGVEYDVIDNPFLQGNEIKAEDILNKHKLKAGDWVDVSSLSLEEKKLVNCWMAKNSGKKENPSSRGNFEYLIVRDSDHILGGFLDGSDLNKDQQIPLSDIFEQEEPVITKTNGVTIISMDGNNSGSKTDDRFLFVEAKEQELTFSECDKFAYVGGKTYLANGHPSAEMAHLWRECVNINGVLFPVSDYNLISETPDKSDDWTEETPETNEIKQEDIAFNEYGEALRVYRVCEDKGVLLSDLKWYDSSELLTGKKGADVKAVANMLGGNHILSSFDSWNAAKVIIESDLISVNSGDLK